MECLWEQRNGLETRELGTGNRNRLPVSKERVQSDNILDYFDYYPLKGT
jgi:hypothetical protein